MGVCGKTSKFYFFQLIETRKLRQPNCQLYSGKITNEHQDLRLQY